MKDPAKKPSRAPRATAEEKLDEEIEESFPVSDPPANTPTFVGGPERSKAKRAEKSKPGRSGLSGYAVERTTKVPLSSPGGSSASIAVNLSTAANRGPWRIAAISASTPGREPRTSASTAPSDRLRTQPETFNLSAARRVNSR
jgi:hypothetical protein